MPIARETTHTNKLSIYIIKPEYNKNKNILKNFNKLKKRDLKGIGSFYYDSSYTKAPVWMKNFFNNSLKNLNLFNSSSKGVLLVKAKQKTFAVTFGYGWTLLNHGVYEERFGLKTALSIINPDYLRKIDKKNMSVSPKNTSEQLTKAGAISDFGIDIEQDLIHSVTGRSKSEGSFGITITGKDSLTVSVKVDCVSIKKFLHLCYEKYSSNEYKKYFDWIDYIAEVKNPKLIEDLNNKLINKIKNNENTIWMAVPEIINWENVAGFKYKKNSSEKNDVHIIDFLDSLTDKEKTNLNIKSLKKKQVCCISSENDMELYRWSVYHCIYCEIKIQSKLYLLNNGKWYEIDQNFVEKVNKIFRKLRNKKSNISLPEFNHKNEIEYNKETSKNNKNFYFMDRKIIQHGGGQGKIEFCDIITKNNEIVHIKRYGNSSVLSHLFNQGLVSGELFLKDEEFRNKVNKKLDNDFKIPNTHLQPKASEYKIIFGVISSSKEDLELPFFSKVGLRTAVERLKTFGYKVYLVKISENS